MSDRTPPKVALWLLRQCGLAYHAESLAGDLIEEYRRGRSLSWLWLQVAAAVRVALMRFLRTLRWSELLGPSFRLAAEVSAVLALVEIVQQNRRTLAADEMMHLWFIVIAAALINLASIGVLASTRAFRRKPAHSLAGALMLALTLAFGVVALSVGELTRADTAHGSAPSDPPGTDSARLDASAQCSANQSGRPQSNPSQSGASQRGDRHCRN